MSNKMLKTLSQKLALGDSKTVCKAEEILRLIDIKNIAIPLNGTAKLVVALDLAATSLKLSIDRAQAIGLAGVGKKNYTMGLQLLENVLNLSQRLSIRDICVRLGCMNVINEALNIAKKYEDVYDKHKTLDCDKPMFLSAAVFVACKKSKTRIDQTKLLEFAKVKKSMLKRIITAMEPLSQHENVKNDEENQKLPKTLLEAVDDKFKTLHNSRKKMRSQIQESEEQNYDSWKQKILANATAATASST